MCPGRFIARQEVYTFVSLALQRFDIALAPAEISREQVFPRLERKKPSLGVMGAVKGHDVLLTVKPRVSFSTENAANLPV